MGTSSPWRPINSTPSDSKTATSARGAFPDNPTETLTAAIEALGMWHGRAYGDLGSEPALINESIRLDEARLATLELRIEADIALGNHAAVVQELEALTREHPFREKLWGFLMLSLYRSGRQADALRAYQGVRDILGDELGIDPSSELQGLEEGILTHDPDLELATASISVDRAARGYELREKLGVSPYGVLYRGFQGSVGREVSVLKLDGLISSSPSFVRRFESEMRAVSELEHPHLVTIYDFWRDPDGAYLVTALPRGGALREVLADDVWNLSSVMRTVDQLGSVLSYLHRNGFVHGALTLDSVLLDDESNAYISDIGLAGLKPDSDRAVSPSDDVSALATVAIALLTGDQTGSVTRPGAKRPDLTELDDLFARAFHPDPASRFEKPEDLSRALRRCIGTDVVASTSEVPTGSRRNPYKGLRAFKESEAGDFHGRDSLVEELIESLASRRLVAVVGPSGSGKSSLVRAGLLPAVRSGSIDGSQNWLIAEMFPGTHPFEELEAALIRVAADRPPGLIDELTSDDRGLARAAKKLIGNDRDELVILIDQFEELFSLVSSETNRRLFLDSLAAAAGDERSRIRFVLTLRADFFDQPLQYPDFSKVMNEGLVPISPPSEEGLTRAIAQPARGVGVDLQPGLVTRIIDDVRDEPGGLPLMQYALTELFNKRENNTMTLAAYEESGGVAGALANRADEIYDDLSAEGKVAARNLFLRLVNVDELADDTRRRVRQTELKGLSLDQTILDDVIQQFGAFRLLSFDRDGATRTPTVEVAHEALIREWDRLRTWIDDRREDLLTHRRIQVTARDWEESEKDLSYLLRGSRLEQALIWQERTDIAISDHEMSFIEASIEQEKRDLAELQALEERSARRRKAVIGVLAGGLLVAGVLSAVALDRAQSERITAAEATARDLSAAAMDAIEEDPELAVLLALEAMAATERLGLSPVPEAITAIRNSQRHLRVDARFEGFQVVDFGPNDQMFVDGPEVTDRSIYVRDATSRELLGTLIAPANAGRPSSVGFADVESLVAVARDYVSSPDLGSDEDLVPAVDIYSGSNYRHLVTLLGPPGYYTAPRFSDNGLVSSTGPAAAYVWNIGGELVREYSDETVRSSEFAPGTNTLVVAFGGLLDEEGEQTPGRVEGIDPIVNEMLWSFETDGFSPNISSVSPDGTMIAIGGDSSNVQIRRIPDGSLLVEIPHPSPLELSWESKSAKLAISGNEGDIQVVSVDGVVPPLVLTGHNASVWNTAFASDGQSLASVSVDGDGRVWNLTAAGSGGDEAVRLAEPPQYSWLLPGESRLLVITPTVETRIVDVGAGTVDETFGLSYQGWKRMVLPNSTYTAISGVGFDGVGALLDLRSGDVIERFAECITPRSVSPSQRYVLLDSQMFCGRNPNLSSYILDRDAGEVLTDLGPVGVGLGAFSPEAVTDSYVVANIDIDHLEIYSLLSGEKVTDIPLSLLEDWPLFTALDRSGKYLGVGTNGSVVIVFDMEAIMSGTRAEDAVAFKTRGHKTNVPFVIPTSDGRVLSAGFEGFYRMSDMETGQKLWEIRAPGLTDVPSASISDDESLLIYEDAHGVVRITSLDDDVVIANAQSALTRTMTDDECRQYLHTDGCED